MPKSIAIQQFEQRLAELGCPPRKIRRLVEEFMDHHADLKREATEEGLAEAEAEARATQLLGEPVELAERLAAVLRRSSWFGRHRIFAFCVLPPLGIFGASVFGLVLVLWLLRLFYSGDGWRELADRGDGFNPLAIGVRCSWFLAIGLTTLLFCRLAKRSGAGVRWMLIACATCSLQSFFGFCRVIPHSTTIGYSTAPNWQSALIPLLIALVLYSRYRYGQLKVREPLGN